MGVLVNGTPILRQLRPGNHVDFDRTQVGLGAAMLAGRALTMLARVVRRPASHRLILDAGSRSVSSDGARGIGAPERVTTAMASAAMLTAPATASPATDGTLAKIMAAFGWGAIGPIASLIGIFHGGRTAARDALDEEERRAWRRHTWTNALLSTVVWGMIPVWWQVLPRPWGYVAPLAAFIVICIVLHYVWAPRIMARRHEAEMRENPAMARTARARERRQQIVGWSIGMSFAALGLAAAPWRTY